MRISKIVFTGFFISLFCFTAKSGVLPKDNSTLNYTSVYFEESFTKGAEHYEFIFQEDSAGQILKTAFNRVSTKVPACWLYALNWGASYYWKIKAYDKSGSLLAESIQHKFSILRYNSSRYDSLRLNIKTNNKAANAGGLLCLDYARTIYNRSGQAVWTFPGFGKLLNDDSQIRNLVVTKDNTITFMTENHALEVDYNGKVLWQAPYPFILNGDTIQYHHDFKKTQRGTYMVLGNKKVFRKMLGNYKAETMKNEFGMKVINNELYRQTEIGVLLEFDPDNRLLWFWDANEYITDEDLNYKKAVNGFPNMSSHANGFNENKKGDKLYLSFRDFSRLIKIDKKSKKVELSYGEKFPSGDGQFGNTIFRTQHDPTMTGHNSILIFNNNGARSGGPSSVMELKDNATAKDSVTLWKFNLDFDTLTNGKSLRGGNVVELPNKNLLVCAGALNRVFEVTKDKKIVWDAFVESRAKGDTTWQSFPQYRANWIEKLEEAHFLCRLNLIDKKNALLKFDLVINNTGNLPDNYIIEVRSEKGDVFYKAKTTGVLKDDSLNKSISVKLKDQVIGNVIVEIRSERNKLIFIKFPVSF